MTPLRDALTSAGCAAALAGILWLGPLMGDQLVLFADREQAADASAARAVMPWPSLLAVAGATLIAIRGRPVHAALAVLPVAAVLLALTMPQTAYQLVAYGVTTPLALGALLAAAIPLGHRR